MTIASDKTRVTLTFPTTFLIALQREAKASHCTLSELIMSRVNGERQPEEVRHTQVIAVLTQHSGQLERLLAILGTVESLVGVAQQQSSDAMPEKSPAATKIVGYEEMYPELAHQANDEMPERSRWWPKRPK